MKISAYKFNAFIWFLLFYVISAQQFLAAAEPDPISITQNPGFKHLQTNLKLLVNKEATTRNNHFFIGKYPPQQGYTYMLWREQKALWILEIGSQDAYHWKQVVQFPRSGNRLNLLKDVVPNKEDIGSSTYLVDQGWVNSVVYDLVMDGDLLTIKKE